MTEREHNDKILSEISSLQAKIDELKTKLVPLPPIENPPLHVLLKSRSKPKTEAVDGEAKKARKTKES